MATLLEGLIAGRKKSFAVRPYESVPRTPLIRCVDGTTLSVQASIDHLCIPRDNYGPYTHVEVGTIVIRRGRGVMPAAWKQHLDFIDDAYINKLHQTYYEVPVSLVLAFVAKHGGEKCLR